MKHKCDGLRAEVEQLRAKVVQCLEYGPLRFIMDSRWKHWKRPTRQS